MFEQNTNIIESFAFSRLNLYITVTQTQVAWEIYALSPLVSPRNDVWATTAEIPYDFHY